MLLWLNNLRFKGGGAIGRVFKKRIDIVLSALKITTTLAGTTTITLDQSAIGVTLDTAPTEIC